MYVRSIRPTWCALPSQPFRNVLQIDQCRYFTTVLTIFIRYKTEIHDNRHIVDAIYMHLFKFNYRSYRYKYLKKTLMIRWIFNFSIDNNRNLVGRLRRWTCNLEAVPCWGFKSYRGHGFGIVTCSVFLAAGLTAFKWNQAWHSSEVIGT